MYQLSNTDLWNALKSQGAVLYWQAVLSFFNIIFIISGFLVTAMGYWMQNTLDKFGMLSDEVLTSVPVLLMIAGYIIIIVGCSASVCTRKSCLLTTYGCCLLCLFLLEVLIIIFIIAFQENIFLTSGKSLNVSMAQYSVNMKQQDHMDMIHAQFECCGYFGPGDWYNTPVHHIPPSCCRKRFCDPTKISEIYSEGCMNKVHSYLSCNLRTILAVVFVAGGLPFFGAVLSFYLSYQMFLASYMPVPAQEANDN